MNHTTRLFVVALLVSICVSCKSFSPQDSTDEPVRSHARIILNEEDADSESKSESERAVDSLRDEIDYSTDAVLEKEVRQILGENVGDDSILTDVLETDKQSFSQPKRNDSKVEFASGDLTVIGSGRFIQPVRGEFGEKIEMSSMADPAIVVTSPGATTNENPLTVTTTLSGATGPGLVLVTRHGTDVGQAPTVDSQTVLVSVDLIEGRNEFVFSWQGAGQSATAASPVVVNYVAPKISIGAADAAILKDLAGTARTKALTVAINVTLEHSPGPGSIVVRNGRSGAQLISEATDGDKAYPITIPLEEGANALTFQWQSAKQIQGSSTLAVNIKRDTTGPILQSAELIEDPATGNQLYMRFADSDWPTTIAGTSFVIKRQDDSGAFATITAMQGEPSDDGRFVSLPLRKIPAGRYELSILGEGDLSLKDELGNAAAQGKDQKWEFTALGDRTFGKHVAFPQYAPPKYEKPPEHGFNPGDFVETRQMRLYYFRDAHRVAQIINRNIRSLNIAAVDQAQRRAESSRDTADQLTDDRRQSEREAVRSAQAARAAANQLDEARRALPTLIDNENKIVEIQTQKKLVTDKITAIETAERTVSEKRTLYEAEQTKIRIAKKNLHDANRPYLIAKKKHSDLENRNDNLTDVAGAPRQPTDEETKEESDALEEMIAAQGTVETKQDEFRKAEFNAAPVRDEYVNAIHEHRKLIATDPLDPLVNEKRQLESSERELQSVISAAGSSTALSANLASMERNVANLRNTAIAEQDSWEQDQAKEDRARERQFRHEVSAANEDPDTYVPGDITSVDPITQCSLSVIGEGLIQIRGPMKGINKVRRMINQIDSPLGQVKIGINTIQVNGEKGGRMEKVIGRIEGHVDLGRFLTSQSLMLLRRAIQEAAASIADQNDQGGHNQVDRDRKYLYGFFGRDFIDELYAMDSEFLRSENKILSLHSMDTISLNRALFALALAKNDVREQIMCRFMELVKCELPQAEWDFRRSSELHPHKTRKWLPKFDKSRIECHTLEGVMRNAEQRYHFRNVRGFFNTGFTQSDTINPTQREFIRLAQIFKSQMVAEVELKQRVIERALIEDPSGDEGAVNEELKKVHRKALSLVEPAYQKLIAAGESLDQAAEMIEEFDRSVIPIREIETRIIEFFKVRLPTNELNTIDSKLRNKVALTPDEIRTVDDPLTEFSRLWAELRQPELAPLTTPIVGSKLDEGSFLNFASSWDKKLRDANTVTEKIGLLAGAAVVGDYFEPFLSDLKYQMAEIRQPLREFWLVASNLYSSDDDVTLTYQKLIAVVRKLEDVEFKNQLTDSIELAYSSRYAATQAESQIERAEYLTNRSRAKLDHRKLLNFLIDEQEEKYIELVEGTRSHIATIDNYLKRLSIALEDDFKLQFYDPAWIQIRSAAREHDVSLGQVEKTTILTNNRAFAKVSPQATMEFDLPKRKIAIVEALDGAKALAQDYGHLLNDPTFLAAFEMMGGAKQATSVKNMLPGLPTSTDQHEMGQVGDPTRQSDSSLQAMVPDPEIYKFETGTGFEIRRVIQPDGDSVVYDFNYMYTTNVREPVAADEKHLGRIKRHFIDTQVQTTSFELREISRYQVALKASRTSKGVPMLEDIPGVGALFRPAPSDESSLQQNIILGSSTVYPTLFDLMGLRWAPHVVDLDHINLLNTEHVVRGRKNNIRDHVFEEASRRVDNFLHLRRTTPKQYRPDLYNQQRAPSMYHPNGYTYPKGAIDPSGKNFQRIDRRPLEFQDPPFDIYRPRPAQAEIIDGQTINGQTLPDNQDAVILPLETEAPPYPRQSRSGYDTGRSR